MGMGVADGKIHPFFLIVAFIIAAYSYLTMKKLLFDLVDEVWDTGDELIIKNDNREDHVPLADIMNVDSTIFTNPPRVTLTLRRPCLFGKTVTFTPTTGFSPFSFSIKHPIVNELIERIDAKRNKPPY